MVASLALSDSGVIKNGDKKLDEITETLNELKLRQKEIKETQREHGITLKGLKHRLEKIDTINKTQGEHGTTLDELKSRLKAIDTIKETLDGIKSRLEDIDTIKETQGKLLRQNNEIINLLRQSQARDTETARGHSPPGSHGTGAGDNADSLPPRPTAASDAQSGPIDSADPGIPVDVDNTIDRTN